MSPVIYGLFFTFLTTTIVLVGDFVLKVAADTDRPLLSGYVLAGGLIYGISAVFWYYAMQYMTLSQVGVIFSMLTLLALCVLGVMRFDEQLFLREYLGIACALAAMVLMVRVT
ncbi:undecaprenyl phosphate-alpha-L-ara4N flippase subunit ArnF [Cognatiyoonia koreensis]|uniref:Undecaprenyl phosphate-alpha-L-ara4N flippase subunit ArnF n=2 Tax=Cognatiyoonia koreensis TaxID=364200 RepID=A0A1I0QS32_9RHOB|nr:undecaprenyl phosphate-alpha-L-ara4N flippase subunit ArnF [Cognatiyoonia koreensis]